MRGVLRAPALERRTLLLGAVALLAPLIALAFAEARVGRTLERRVYDGWFTLRGPLPRPAGVAVVAIDLDSEASLGRYPWSRAWHARLLRNLRRAGARVVAFDLTFADPTPDDSAFRAAIDETGIAVLGAKTDVVFRRGARGFRLEEPVPAFRGVPIGIVDERPDPLDDVLREYPVLHAYPQGARAQLGVVAVMRYLGLPADSLREVAGGWRLGGRFIPRGPAGGMLLDYAGPTGSVATHSYVTVVDDAATNLGEWDLDSFEDLAAAGVFRDRIVFVGTTIPEHHDLHSTPFRDAGGAEGAVLLPGVEIHAQAAAAILARRHLRPVPRAAQYAWTAILALAAVVALARLRALRGTVVAAVLATAAVAAAWLLFTHAGVWLWTVAPVLGVSLAWAGSTAVLVTDEALEKTRIRRMFQQYLPPAVVRELIHRPELLALGGEERVATVLFSDVKDFSRVAEGLAPTRLVALLNEYLTAMTDVVVEHGGVIDKYLGDSLMAEFGVPVPLDDHAVRACRAALRMRDELRRLREEWKRRGMPALYARIGINTGQVLVGNLGSFRMMDYTCMGDHVNLASRMEGANKEYRTEILVSEFTWREVQTHFVGREIDRVRVMGRAEPVGVYELVAVRDDAVDERTAALVAGFAEALALCRDRQFAAALAAFEALSARYPDDGPSAVYLERCRKNAVLPPPLDWDGIFQLASK
ncbi:MAG TPA: adenylate/guanylate cyclase domain-containing protein [Longimicrobium sp.]|jgi:adenylate cyclase|nr:adenylate/guanylate cyclase domain-containing protein [Longimicrobium sp.]